MVFDNIKQTLRSYKSNQASKYIPVRGDEILTKVFECEKYNISTKYDGHLCFIVKEKNEIQLLNFNGNSFERKDLTEELNTLLNNNGILVGEIFSYKENERRRSFDLVKDLNNKDSSIKIAVFDVINYNGNSFEKSSWEEKKKLIEKLFSKGENVFPVKELEVTSRKDIQSEFQERVNYENQEGLVVRGFNGPIFKIKPKLTFDFVVLGYSLGYSDNFTLLKELLFGVLINKDEYLIVGKLGGGFTNNQRSSFVEDLKNLKVESNLIEPSGSKIPFTFIKPALVVEVEYVDIINSASNKIIKKPVIKFEENKFSKTGNKPSVSLISPVFKGFRDDKKIDFDQVGLVQIKRIIELNDEIIEAPNKSKTKVLKKEVYVKEIRGTKMVKKFFIWETNSSTKDYQNLCFIRLIIPHLEGINFKEILKFQMTDLK